MPIVKTYMFPRVTGDMNSSDLRNCSYEFPDYLEEKFALMVVFLPILSCFGAAGNILSIWVFSSKGMCRKSANSYLLAISVSDLVTILMAVMLYSVELGVDYFEDSKLSNLWHRYLKFAFVVSHAAPFATVYFSLAATFERWMALSNPLTHATIFSPKGKIISSLLLTLFSVGFCTGKLFEFDILERGECDDLARFHIVRSHLNLNSELFQFYNVWISSFVSCLIPFCLLLSLNIMVTVQVIRVANHLKLTRYNSGARRIVAKPREATVIIIFVAFSFLICNFPSFILTLVEHSHLKFLEENIVFYGFCKDAITLLTALSASMNPLIYLTNSRSYRKQLRWLLGIKDSRQRKTSTLVSFVTNGISPSSSNGDIG